MKENPHFEQIKPDLQLALLEVDYSQPDVLAERLRKSGLSLAGLKRISNPKRRTEWLSTRILLMDLLQREVDIIYDEHGKPYLKDQSLHLSVSHSHHRIALITHPTAICGIDIQHITDKIFRIREKFLHEQELAEMLSMNLESLHVYWSAKEALFKVYGRKDIYLKDDIYIFPFEYSASGGEVQGRFCTKNNSKTYSIHYELVDDYMMAYVVNP